MPAISFTHPLSTVGSLTIDTGMDAAQWAYGLNTVTFPTYGGEVVQILSVYIDDLTLTGTVTSYAAIETIYMYFANFFQTATQGTSTTPQQGVSAYNFTPMTFTYPERDWLFYIIPKTTPGFRYGREVVAPQWQLTAHVVDDSPDSNGSLNVVKDGIKEAAISSLDAALPAHADSINMGTQTLTINGEISPQYGDPNSDPWQTYDASQAQSQQDISKYADYYNSLIPAYMQGNFDALTSSIGSQPNFGQTHNQNTQNSLNNNVPSTPASATQKGSTDPKATTHGGRE